MKNIYVLELPDKKVLLKLIKYGFHFEKIDYLNNKVLIYIDKDNYQNIVKYQNIFKIKLVKIEGLNKYLFLLKKNYLFIITNIISLIIIIFLSNIIFSIKIETNDLEITKILKNELNYYGIKEYKFAKSFKEKELIKENILKDHKDKIEWLEITRKGTSYVINVERRIINKDNKDNIKRNVISKKNAIIKEIKASHGMVVKKINDYVNKGDIIVTGIITKGDKVMDYVDAKALIYGETWYNVKVSIPLNYYEKKYTGRIKKRFSFNFLNKKIKLFNKDNYINEEINEHILIKNPLIPIYISYDEIKEFEEIKDLLTNDKIISIGMTLAKEKLIYNLSKDSKILSQKKLKLRVNNSTIVLDVFFKVYENITDYENILSR